MEGIRCLGGVRMACLGFALMLALLMTGLALAGTFTSEPLPSTYEAQVAPNISFDLTNTDLLHNITNITVIFPSTLEFVTGSNYTNMSDFIISNTASSFMWGNTTVEGILEKGSSTYLNMSFMNMTAPGNYIFELNITFTDDSYDNETHNITIQDTKAPAGITTVSPTLDNSSYTDADWFEVNVTFTELNPDTCLLDLDNVTAENYTMAMIGSYACYFNATGQDDGYWNYSVWINDTSGNLGWNGGWFIGVDAADPVGNSLGLFYQGENVSGGNITELDDINISVNVTDMHSGINITLDDVIYANITKSGSVVAVVNLTHTSGDIFNGTWDVAQNNSGDGNYSINITATDIAGNSNDSVISATLEILGAPDLTVMGVEWSSSNSNPGWPISSDNIILNITIKNIGDGNFTGTFNVSTDIDGSERDLSTLGYLNESESVTLNLTLTSGNFSTNKYYTFSIEVDPEDVVNESAETNNTYVFGFNLGYNISLVKFNGAAWPSVGSSYPDDNVSVNISVTGGNGTGVTGLGQNDFEFWNKYDGWQSSNINVTDRIYSFSGAGSGYYVFTFNTEGLDDTQSGGNRTRARFGDNYLNISAVSGSYSGMSLLLYNITAPDLEVLIDDDEIDEINLAGASYKDVDMNVTLTNNGNAPIYHIYVDEDNEENWVFVHDDFSVDHSDVSNEALDPGESYPIEAELRVEETHPYEYNLYLFVYGNDSVDNRYKGYAREKVEVIDTGSGEEEEDDGGTTSSGDTLDLELTIMDWDDYIDCYPGGSNTTRIDVKNTGDVTVVAKVSFTCDVLDDDPTIAPVSKSLAVGTSQEFIIDFDIDGDAEIGEYDCTAKAYISSSEDDYDTETIVLRVLATAEVAEEINHSCHNLSATLEGLFERFSRINPALVNDTNLTRVENLLNNANSTLHDILEAIESGDYITAHELIESLNTSLGGIESGLDDLELEQGLGGGLALSGTWFWAIIIIVVVIAVAFVAYLLFPQRGYGPKKGVFDNLKDTLRGGAARVGEIKEKGKAISPVEKKPFRPSSYAKGYEKRTAGAYSYRGGPAGKIKGAFSRLKDKLKRKKKPQKEVTQYFASSSSNIINYS
jgi:hypothetical protein